MAAYGGEDRLSAFCGKVKQNEPRVFPVGHFGLPSPVSRPLFAKPKSKRY
jgi:hypothetical protein